MIDLAIKSGLAVIGVLNRLAHSALSNVFYFKNRRINHSGAKANLFPHGDRGILVYLSV